MKYDSNGVLKKKINNEMGAWKINGHHKKCL